MRLRHLLLFFVGVALCVSSPVFATTTVFFDDFEHGDPAGWDLIGTPVVPVGSWSLNGGTTANSLMAYWSPAGSGLPDSNVFGGTKYGATIRGGPDVTNGVVTNADARFGMRGDAADLVRFEADIYGQDGNGSSGIPADLKIAIISGANEANAVTLSGGAANGTVSIGGVATSLMYSLNEWHHVAMEYSPTASTFTLAIDDQAPLTGAMTTPSAVNGFRFVQTSAGQDRWSCFDNVQVTAQLDAPIVASGTYTEGNTPPALPTSNLILQGSDTLSGSFAGGSTAASWGAQLPGGMNDGVMTAANVLPILAWDGVTEDFGWAVYELDTSTNTLGYDVSEILSYAGWTGARVNQAVEVKYALVGDTVTEGEELDRSLGMFYYTPSDNTTPYAYTTMSIANEADPLVLAGVSAIEVKYIDNMFNGNTGHPVDVGNYTAYKQLAVIGTPTTTTRTPGDANEDGYVDVTDLGILATNYSASGTWGWGDGDFDGDTLVNVTDLGILATWYGTTPDTQSVPEPSTLVGLLGLCLAGLVAHSRREQ